MRQIDLLLGYLERNGSINPIQAFNELGIYRLSARIKDLRDSGKDIKTTTKKGSSIAIYTLTN